MSVRFDRVPGVRRWNNWDFNTYPWGLTDGNGAITINGRWNWTADDLANPLAGATAFTVALTIKPDSPMTDVPTKLPDDKQGGADAYLLGAWTDAATWQMFRLQHLGAGILCFTVSAGPSGQRQCYSHLWSLRAAVWNRIVVRWQANPELMSIWVDGANRTRYLAGTPIAALNTALRASVFFGGCDAEDAGGCAACYAEGAVWTAYKSDDDVRLYGRGASPDVLSAGGRWKYVSLVNTEDPIRYLSWWTPGFDGGHAPVTDHWYLGGFQYGQDADTYNGYYFGRTVTIPYQGYFQYPLPSATQPHPTVFGPHTERGQINSTDYLPIADFTWVQSDFAVPTIQFTDASVGATEWDWDWGDGTTHGTTQNPSHTYLDPVGWWQVTLISGGPAIKSTPVSRYVETSVPAAAQFGWAQYPYTLDMHFLSTALGPATAWDWNFGDGSSHATTDAPVHTYASAGTYTVTLTASNGPAGVYSSSISHTVTVVAIGASPEVMPATDATLLPTAELEVCERSGENVGKRSTRAPFVVTTFTQLVTAIGSAQYGDTIRLTHGLTYQADGDWGIGFPNSKLWTLDDTTPRMPPPGLRGALAATGTVEAGGTLESTGTPSASAWEPSYVLVTTDGALPAVPVLRIAVEDDANYPILAASGRCTPALGPQLATLQAHSINGVIFNFRSQSGYFPHQWYFRGLRFIGANQQTGYCANFFTGLNGGSNYGYDRNVGPNFYPDHLVWQQCLFDADAYGYGVSTGSFTDSWSGGYLGLINCYFDNFIVA